MSSAENTSLWKAAFANREGDEHAAPRERLKYSLEKMRENVGDLLKMVPADCKDLTVHDVTHLDALWEMSSLLIGETIDLNPAETFVLGAAILLHDAGLSTASFPGGLAELKGTIEWRDSAAAYLRQNGKNPTPELIENPPSELLPNIKFSVLRALHAAQAEKMAIKPWTLLSGEQIYLLEDLELRQSFGDAIGRIAHSHHWSIDKVAETLIDNVGTGTVLPTNWSVSERRIACILRCADACHIDRRRAPTMLYAATKPQGLSDTHWKAQNKINKPTVKGSKIIFTAGQPFKVDESAAWWLVHDLVKTADDEIRASNALLEEIGFEAFAVKRVLGAESTRALAAQIRVDGWRPVDAEVRVSDPINLAKSLGGRNLYGDDVRAPIRELLQNAADAIRARRQLEDRPATWGEIRLTIEPHSEEPDACWLHLDDDGIGMSERVLAGPLIDFGKSIWNSGLLREEFPGLESKNLAPVGKFGIGFFSVFELGQSVKVISRRYDTGYSDTKVLEFSGISTRPIVRPAREKELPRDSATRITVKIDNQDKIRNLPHLDPRMRSLRPVGYYTSLHDEIIRMTSMLDVKFEYLDKVAGKSFQHSPSVYESAASEFLDELYTSYPERSRDSIKATYASLLRPIEDAEGRRFGRAALLITGNPDRFQNMTAVSVGGFVLRDSIPLAVPIVGVVVGETENAARQVAAPKIPPEALQKWATDQAQAIISEREKFRKIHLLQASASVMRLGGDPLGLPYCFTKNKLEDLSGVEIRIRRNESLVIPLYSQYQSSIKLRSYTNIRADYFELNLKDNVFVLNAEENDLFDDELIRLITKEGRSSVSMEDIEPSIRSLREFIAIVRRVWSSEIVLTVEDFQVFEMGVYSPPSSGWALILKKAAAS